LLRYVKSVADNNICGYLPRTYVQFVEDIDLEKGMAIELCIYYYHMY